MPGLSLFPFFPSKEVLLPPLFITFISGLRAQEEIGLKHQPLLPPYIIGPQIFFPGTSSRTPRRPTVHSPHIITFFSTVPPSIWFPFPTYPYRLLTVWLYYLFIDHVHPPIKIKQLDRYRLFVSFIPPEVLESSSGAKEDIASPTFHKAPDPF